MASTATGLVDWVASRLASVVDGTGSYINDLTADDVVAVQDFPAPSQVVLPVQVFVYDEDVQTVPGRPLTGWDNTMTVYIAGFVSGDGTARGARAAALDLAADIHRAFRTDRVASGATILSTSSVHDVRVASQTLDGNALGFQGRAVLAVGVTILYRGDF